MTLFRREKVWISRKKKYVNSYMASSPDSQFFFFEEIEVLKKLCEYIDLKSGCHNCIEIFFFVK